MNLLRFYLKDIIITLLLITGIILGVYLAQRTHILKSRASGGIIGVDGDTKADNNFTVNHKQGIYINFPKGAPVP